MSDLDRKVAQAMGLKSVNNCEKWSNSKMKDPEDEAFEELALKQGQWHHISGWRKKQIADRIDDPYEMGWNSALEMAAFKLQHDFKQAFGDDTLASIAVYIKGMKK